MNNENLNATLRCVTRPSAAQEEKIKTFLKNKYQAHNITLNILIDPSVRGGFILSANNDEYDWSTRSRQQQLQEQIQAARDKAIQMKKDGTLMSILKEAIEQFEATSQENEVGYVETIGDGIATILGLDHAMYGEVVVFENGTKGMVLDITTENIGVILFDTEGTIGQGTKVSRTKKQAGMPVSSNFLGRVVDPLGNPIDGLGPIEATEMRPIEEPAPSIIDRKPVTTPMETGILSIDSMFPIGRGQRELIIGDRQTGKTSIALDTILNQKGKDCICIYVSIAQKASTVANLVNTLKKNDAMDYTVIVNSTAADSASLQYIAPYSATSLAEYFMHQGKDVLIVYDDLSKHAVAYRTISLLLGRSPGREAYPGDVFYLHSRLLERSSRLNSGGSITALPIIETQDGDVSAYIPTNVISITDGQIFLESDLFFEGQRPAVNVGLSVSRVGGAAQTKAMKKASGSLRINLAQYREMKEFTQFASDLDDATKRQLQHGQVLMELLKQPLNHPMSHADMVIVLVVADAGILDDLDPKQVKKEETKLLDWFNENHSEISREINTTKKLDDNLKTRIITLAKQYRGQE
ncbi:F0F1 ATP synthase subunit alpha [Holdemanella biformis]|uniref:F0F1 ATP synthase subunit alpha n=1 Tax=Holdemanella biformis TaxID=1735 RepID=UPI0018993591|nr:F0F1 ATP synthase subunit alpha [Holdemanella biformis]